MGHELCESGQVPQPLSGPHPSSAACGSGWRSCTNCKSHPYRLSELCNSTRGPVMGGRAFSGFLGRHLQDAGNIPHASGCCPADWGGKITPVDLGGDGRRVRGRWGGTGVLSARDARLSRVDYDFNRGRNRMGRDISEPYHFGGSPCPWVGGRKVLTQGR